MQDDTEQDEGADDGEQKTSYRHRFSPSPRTLPIPRISSRSAADGLAIPRQSFAQGRQIAYAGEYPPPGAGILSILIDRVMR